MIGAVVIGRNEGPRLQAALASLAGDVDRVVYVDSGSTDNSLEIAAAAQAEVVILDPNTPFTAALARNTGFDRLMERDMPLYVQFIDGDCAVRKGWIETAKAFLETNKNVAVVCGRRRERFPEASAYNALTDAEWDTPIGRTRACGGDALMRVDAFKAVGGYTPTLIAGEEPELCVRLRAQGWEIWRLDAEMTWHDAAMTRFDQWWKRTRRAGHAYAEGAALHGHAPELHNVAQLRRALFWGLALPLVALLGTLLVSPWVLLALLVYPAQIVRLRHMGWTRASFLTFGKLAEAQGALDYIWRRLRGGPKRLIEYK